MNKVVKRNRYKNIDDHHWIEVRVKSAQQLFDARDPAPFRERDLDDDFVEYVLASAKELTSFRKIKLVIYIEETESQILTQDSIKEAILSFLEYKIELHESEMRSYVKRAQIYFLVGLCFLATCVTIANQIEVVESHSLLGILREGIVIFGWVAIWKPLEQILFDWYPIFENIRFYKKLYRTSIDIKFGS